MRGNPAGLPPYISKILKRRQRTGNPSPNSRSPFEAPLVL